MTDAKTNPELARKIKGLVSDIIKTDSKYDLAIATALGVAVQHIATASPEDAQYLINYLKQTGSGTATFLPVSSMKMRPVGEDTKIALRERGSIGLATEIISYDKYYESVISFLLGNTLVVDNLENAVTIAKKYRFGFKIVTLDGDVLNTSGSMTGGSRKQNNTNLLAMDRKVEEIEKELLARRSDREKLIARKDQLLKQVEEEKIELEKVQVELQQFKLESVALRERIAALEISIEDIRLEIESNKDDISLINVRLTDLNKKYSDIELGNEELNKKKEMASSDAEKHLEDYESYSVRRVELTDENLKVQERIVFLKGEIKASTEEIERMKAERIEKESVDMSSMLQTLSLIRLLTFLFASL
jgi:chromosome segregation protein